MNDLIDRLKDVVGPGGYRQGADIDAKNYQDVMGARSIPPLLLLRPASTEQVSRILALCHEAKQPIAPQGGMTGLVSAAAPLSGEIALSFERMKNIIEVDKFGMVVAFPGCCVPPAVAKDLIHWSCACNVLL